MLDYKYVLDNEAEVRGRLSHRSGDAAALLDPLIELARKRSELTAKGDDLKHKRNEYSREIGRLKREKQDASELMEQMQGVADEVKQLDHDLREVQAKMDDVLLAIPNVPHADTPTGASEDDNELIRTWGEPKKFSFTPQAHWDIGEALGILDLERAAKITGSRFAVLKGAAAALERALITFFLDTHTTKNGYTEVIPPFLVNRDSATGTGQLPKFEEDLFVTKDPELFLIPTAEVPVTNLHRDEILEQLPIKYCAYTPCFRREAGAYGKDTRGLIRQHQFNKVELVKFVDPATSYNELESLVNDAEGLLQALELPYRVMRLCTGDIGFGAAMCYDLEVWLPSQKTYREISSCSNFEAFQARRSLIRYRPEGKKKTELVHTLNGSGLAIGRTAVAILENYQQEDGSVVIPEVLQPYMGGRKVITRP